jgi:copper homeostasis protein
MANPSIVLEICADSVESARAAEQGGACRVDLCGSLIEGGVTPSAGRLAAVRNRISIPLHVMVRPRGGDFCYRADEFEVMRQDVLTAKQLGADGAVFGILLEDGDVDRQRTQHLIELARPMNVTFHRAFDMARDLSRALEEIVSTGAERVLTSGGEDTAAAGAARIAKLLKQAGKRIVVVAASGINESNVREVLARTGVSEIHASLGTSLPSPMRHRKERISMGTVAGVEYNRRVVARERVELLLRAVREGE